MADIARIIEVIEPEVQALGFELVRVVLYKGGEIGSLSGDYDEPTLQIMAERPETGQLVLDDCAALSHRISDRIDALEEVMEEGAGFDGAAIEGFAPPNPTCARFPILRRLKSCLGVPARTPSRACSPTSSTCTAIRRSRIRVSA